MAIKDFDDWMNQSNIQQGQPLDTGAGKRPYTDFDDFMGSQQTAPTELTTDTQQAVQQQQPTAPSPQNGQVSDLTPQAPQEEPGLIQQGINTAVDFGSQALDVIEEINPLTQIGGAIGGMLGDKEDVKDFVRDEGLPTALGTAATVGAAGVLLGVTAPVSVPLAILGTAAAAFGGAAIGEFAEQQLKSSGLIDKPETEAHIKTTQDMLEQAAWRGGEEALFSAIPDVVMFGSKAAMRKIFAPGTEDIKKQAMSVVINKELEKRATQPDHVFSVSDVVDFAAFDMMDAIAGNSLMKGRLKETRAAQEEIVKEAVTGNAEVASLGAKAFAADTTDEAIKDYVGANFETMNAHAVGAIVRKSLRDAQSFKKNLARAKYNVIGDSMEPGLVNQKQKLTDTGRVDKKGNTVFAIQTVAPVETSFPVNLVETRKIAEDQATLASNLTKDDGGPAKSLLSPEMQELISFGDTTDYKSAAAKLAQLKGESRGMATNPEMANRKRLVDDAVHKLESALGDSLDTATAAGVRGPNGEDLSQLKMEADEIWKKQSDDFGNKFIQQVLKQTDSRNGNPGELARLFLQDTTHAIKISEALEQGMKEAPEQMEAAKSAIKGHVMEKIFMPFDTTRGKYASPSYADLEGNKEALGKMFDKDELQGMEDLANALSFVNKEDRANVLSFAQQARESGQAQQVLQNPSDFLPNVQKLFGTLFVAFGGSRVMTNPSVIKKVSEAVNPDVPLYIQKQYQAQLFHTLGNFFATEGQAMTPEQRERWDGDAANQKDYSSFLNQTKQ